MTINRGRLPLLLSRARVLSGARYHEFPSETSEPIDSHDPALVVSQWACADGDVPPRRLDDPLSPGLDGWPAALVLPPALGPLFEPGKSPGLTDWIAQAHAHGCIAASACAGPFVLAQAGLLDRRPATTHWAYDATFRARLDKVLLDTDQLLIDDGDVITAGGSWPGPISVCA